MNKKTEEYLQMDLDHIVQTGIPIGNNLGIVFESADGIRVRDTEGKEYIEGSSTVSCLTLGYGYKNEVADAVAEQMRKYPYSLVFFGYNNVTTLEYAKKLAEFTPGDLNHFCFATGGSEAIKTMYMFARMYWHNKGKNKYKIISTVDGYHGTCYATLSSTGMGKDGYIAMKGAAPTLLGGFIHIPSYYCYRCMLGLKYPECGVRCAKILDDYIEKEGPETVAAFIVEPVMNVAGEVAPPPEYMPMIREICNKYDVLFLTDEVMTAFGRTGENFAVDHWGVVPDMMVAAKGVSAAYLPFAALAVNDKVFEGLRDAYYVSFTHSGHPVCCAAAMKVLEITIRDKIVENVQKVGKYCMDRLEAEFLPLPHVGEVRGLGLALGVEIVEDKEKHLGFDLSRNIIGKITVEARRQGLLLSCVHTGFGAANAIKVCPPLVCTKQDIDDILGILYPIVANINKPGSPVS